MRSERHGPERCGRIKLRARLEGAAQLHHALNQGIVDGFVDKQPGTGHADLATAHEKRIGGAAGREFDRCIGHGDSRPLAAEFQGDALQGLGRRLLDQLAGPG